MSPDMKIFLAALASTPVLGLFILVMTMLLSDEIVDIIHALQIWLFLTVILAVAVLAVGGMYFVWTWAL